MLVLNIVNIASDKSNLCKKFFFLFHLFFINDFSFLILKTGVKRSDVKKDQCKRGQRLIRVDVKRPDKLP